MDLLAEIYTTHGVWVTSQVSLMLGQPGGAQPGLVQELRDAGVPDAIGGRDVRTFTDLSTGERRHSDGTAESVALPSSNVLVYHLDGDARVIVRPSGTEPKIKFYYEVRVDWVDGEDVSANIARARQALDALSSSHQGAL